MNPPSSSLPPTPETAALRAEWRAARRSGSDHAMQALHALAESAPPPADEDLPPLPDHLRSRWEEAYGQAADAVPVPAGQHPLTALLQRFVAAFSPARMAWSGGLVAAAVAVLLMVRSGDPGTDPYTGPVTRGGGTITIPATAAPILVLAPAGSGDALLRTLRAAFPARTVELRESADLTATDAAALVVDVSRRLVRTGSGDPLALAADPLLSPDAVVTAIETLDEAAPAP